MLEEKPKIPLISISQTGGLSSIQQLIDVTPNEIFSFKEGTSKAEEISIVYLPSYEGVTKPEKKERDFLEEFKSIVKTKLRKPIDLKKLYYEQIEHDIL